MQIKRILPGIFILLPLLYSGCEKENQTTLPPEILSFWKLAGYGAKNQIEYLPDSINIDLYIGSIYSRGNDIDGESPFRNYWGRFILDGNKISFYDLRVTDVLTPDDSVTFYRTEKRYLDALKRSSNYIIENDVLTIHYTVDSSLVFLKNSSTVYSDKYEMSNEFDGQEWVADSILGALIDRDYSGGQYYVNIGGKSDLRHSDGRFYQLGIQVNGAPRKGTYYQNPGLDIHAVSYPDDNPNDIRSESTSGYLRIDRISRRFLTGEYELHMTVNGSSEEFDIVKGKFKAPVHSIGLPWYKSYQ
jgi:heat shock protein HslJ